MSGILYVFTAMVVILLVGTVFAEIIHAIIRHLCRVNPRVRGFFNRIWFE